MAQRISHLELILIFALGSILGCLKRVRFWIVMISFVRKTLKKDEPSLVFGEKKQKTDVFADSSHSISLH